VNRIVRYAVFIVVMISLCYAYAQNSSATDNGASSNTAMRGTSPGQQPASSQPTAGSSAEKPSYALIPTLLVKPLDSKKVKVGDEVVAKTSVGMKGNGMLIPKGGKVMGHITEAQARSKGDSQSSLGIAFDKVELADGRWLAIQATITAVGPNPYPEVTTGAAGGFAIAEPSMGAGAGTAAGPMPTVTNPQDMSPDLERRKLVNPQSTGVIDMKNLSLDKNSVLTTNAKELKLESGTQFVIRATVKSPAP